jgi:hypothetical protein
MMLRTWIAGVVLAALVAPAAHAGIIAAVDVPVGGTDAVCPTQTDIALIDPATGARSSLPAGVNTSSVEEHPSINGARTRLTFARVDPSGGTTRIIAVDLATGQQADLFSFFDSVQTQPTTPSFSADGGSVLTGAALQQLSGSSQFAVPEMLTSLANFPVGPFPHSSRVAGATFPSAGETIEPTQRSDGLIASDVISGSHGGILLDTGGLGFKLASGGHPALSDPATNVVVFQHLSGSFDNEMLAFRPVGTFDSAPAVDLPPIINPDHFDELNPAFTSDGRYLGFVRYAHGGDRHVRLFVFDTATQTMLSSDGVDLGILPSFACKIDPTWPFRGGLSLHETLQLLASSINLSGGSGLVSFELLQSSAVGILVQRVVGHHRLFGRRVPTLKIVGRVPFGQFRHGRHKVRWSLRVNGRRLRPGTYLVTPRLLTRNGVVRELGKPRLLRIR